MTTNPDNGNDFPFVVERGFFQRALLSHDKGDFPTHLTDFHLLGGI